MGNAYSSGKNEQFHKAIEAYKEAARLNPKHQYVHLNLADALQNNGNFKEAIEEYGIVIRDTQHQLGLCLMTFFLSLLSVAVCLFLLSFYQGVSCLLRVTSLLEHMGLRHVSDGRYGEHMDNLLPWTGTFAKY